MYTFYVGPLQVREKEGMTFDQDFVYSFPPFLFPAKREKRKEESSSKNRDQKSCLSARSLQLLFL